MSEALRCLRCGKSIEPGAARCEGCGCPARQSNVDLRHGTFLFCDLVGSTRLINSLDPDEQLDVMRAMRSVVPNVLSRHGGRNERFDGDGYFVSFIGPDSLEGDATVAIRVGLEIAESMRAAGERIGKELLMRVGIASGSVLVGYHENSTILPDAGYIGAAVNLAKRLATAAPAGCIVIADSTRREAGGFFEYESMPNLDLQGFDESIQAWLVTRPSGIRSRYLASHPVDEAEALFGRDAELELIDESWRKCLAGRRATLRLHGDAGIGKSSLAYRACDRAGASSALVLELDCTPRTTHTSFYPLSGLLRRLAGVSDGMEPVHSVRLVQDWLTREGDKSHSRALAPYLPMLLMQSTDARSVSDQAVARSTTALVRWIKSCAAKRPVLLCAEDIHWADAATLDLLSALAGDGEVLPLMILTTSRHLDPKPDALGRVVVNLTPLDQVSAREFVLRAAGPPPLDESTVDMVVSVAEGIPLYLEELARAANSAGGVRVFKPGAPLPARLAFVMQARIDRLPGLRQIVQTASILGRDFSVDVLRWLVEDPAVLPEAVTRIVDEGLWERQQGGEMALRFKHVLIHEAVYSSLLAGDRRHLHSRVADILQTQFADHATVTQDIVGHHLAVALRHNESAACYLTAASTAAARGAFPDAAAHCGEGIAQAKRAPASAESRALLRQLFVLLGLAKTATSGYAADEVEAAYESARALCAADDDPATLFPIVRGLGTFNFVRARFAEAHRLALRCVELATLADRIDYRIEALSFLGYTELYRGNIAAAREALESCVSMYKSAGGENFSFPSPQDAGTSALALLGTVAWLQGDCRAAEQAIADAQDHAKLRNRPIDKAYVLAWLSMQRNLQRRFEHARSLAEECVAVSEEHGFRTWLAAGTMQRCIAMGAAAASQEAVGTLSYVLGEFKRAGAEANSPYFEWGIATGALLTGDTATARESLQRALAASEVSGETYLRAELLVLQCQLTGDPEIASRGLVDAFELAAGQGAHMLALRAASAWLALNPTAGSTRSATLATAFALLAGDESLELPVDGWAGGAVKEVQALLTRELRLPA
jgi:class 3 adenylate cyclase